MLTVGIDVGGTFTDAVVLDSTTGEVRHTKAPTTPRDPLSGLTSALAQLGIRATDSDLFVHGTTLVTNLILERAGCRVGLITTQGFRDVLEIQRSYRPEPLDLQWIKPEPLVPRDLRLEIHERTLSDGTIEAEPDRSEVLEVTDRLIRSGAEAIAVCLLNSYANPANERQVSTWITTQHPELPVSPSFVVDPRVREYERCSTTVVNAYSIPAVRSYIHELESRMRPDVLFMHSGGGVLPSSAVADKPVKLVQSGPAGGVIATRELGRAVGRPNLISFDMGGTSTDVSVIVAGEVQWAPETEVTWGIPIRAESLEIQGIGAGGGSIASRDAGGGLQVGPRSAGAEPGPACYSRGGREATVTDANVLLGLLHPDRFLGGQMRLDREASDRAVGALAREFGLSSEEMALGIHRVVNANMAQLIREMTVNKGRDPRDFTLVSFGGAGGQHAYGVAEMVGCREVLFPRRASTFSALGLVSADIQTSEGKSMLLPLASINWEAVLREFQALESLAKKNLGAGSSEQLISVRRAMARYVGQTHEVLVEVDDGANPADFYNRFQSSHAALFGTKLDDPAEIVSLHLTLMIHDNHLPQPQVVVKKRHATGEVPTVIGRPYIPLFQSEAPVYAGHSLAPGIQLSGPALVEETDTVIVVPRYGRLSLERDGATFSLRLDEAG